MEILEGTSVPKIYDELSKDSLALLYDKSFSRHFHFQEIQKKLEREFSTWYYSLEKLQITSKISTKLFEFQENIIRIDYYYSSKKLQIILKISTKLFEFLDNPHFKLWKSFDRRCCQKRRVSFSVIDCAMNVQYIFHFS